MIHISLAILKLQCLSLDHGAHAIRKVEHLSDVKSKGNI